MARLHIFILRNARSSPEPPDPMTPDRYAVWKSRSDAAINSKSPAHSEGAESRTLTGLGLAIGRCDQQLSQHRENRTVARRIVLTGRPRRRDSSPTGARSDVFGRFDQDRIGRDRTRTESLRTPIMTAMRSTERIARIRPSGPQAGANCRTRDDLLCSHVDRHLRRAGEREANLAIWLDWPRVV